MAHSTGASEEELPTHGLWARGAGHCCADVTIWCASSSAVDGACRAVADADSCAAVTCGKHGRGQPEVRPIVHRASLVEMTVPCECSALCALLVTRSILLASTT